jgi:hypothetical protein
MDNREKKIKLLLHLAGELGVREGYETDYLSRAPSAQLRFFIKELMDRLDRQRPKNPLQIGYEEAMEAWADENGQGEAYSSFPFKEEKDTRE